MSRRKKIVKSWVGSCQECPHSTEYKDIGDDDFISDRVLICWSENQIVPGQFAEYNCRDSFPDFCPFEWEDE